MRHIEHPGPAHPERVQCEAAQLHPIDVQLPQGASLLQGLTEVVHAHNASCAVFSLNSGAFAPLAFYIPALSPSPKHVAYFSDRFESSGQIDSGCITFGRNNGQPWLHCHAIWTQENGQRRSGHLIAEHTYVATPVSLQGWILEGAGFDVAPDAETNFNLLQVAAQPPRPKHSNALVVRLRPNQDICLALEALCHQHNIRHANIRGGVGSLIGATFEDGRIVEPFATEVFIHQGKIEPNAQGELRATIDIGLVDYTGAIAEGRLKRGENPVLITFELVIEPQEASLHTEQRP